MSEKKMNIYEKLASMQTILLATKINKSGVNKHNGAKYYELEDLLPPVKIVCKQFNILTYFNFPYSTEIMGYKAELHLRDLDSNEELVFEVPYPELEKINNGMNIMQSEGAYITYLKRYLLLNTFDLLEKEIIDASNWDNNDDTRNINTAIVIDERPAVLQKVIDRCHKDFSKEECNAKLLNKVSLKMLKENEISKAERKEIFEYLKEKK